MVPGRSEPWLVNRNPPVGEGGCVMSSRSMRKSTPPFSEWRPRCRETVSTSWVTSVVESEFVLAGEPSCWNPSTVKVGSAFSNAALVGMPGRPSSADGVPSSSRPLRVTPRRV